MRTLVVATQNPGKLAELQQLLGQTQFQLQPMPPELEIAETGATFQENAILKARQTAQYTGHWAIADDSGLAIEALDGAPGIYSARYAETAQARIDRVLRELKGQSNRRAQFVCHMAVAQPDGQIVAEAEGICPGEILEACVGAGGFGYDPIFWVPSQQQTFAQMGSDLKHEIGHRGLALQQLMPQLQHL
ncbi:RdgB/HAM1 family non-canonical purine NTP pyrophosphatase [Lyngbya confervoides]|uniref:dITP/XTP pyrophosphatase n=1 Tax=Lyngbya confervoides BDU141951 TaxID=1574623 RepID=A0ABD4T4L5_9CYAN|nr:RdgB/HAM1 family non-canonical purine NTP pyrophosphatase [Lyngbya confervoides]MCM1983534.1 RdgB/HAM1 family non-canonical purine NTP pyrophosphatase [Lyngbya confervoides BDU141951]